MSDNLLSFTGYLDLFGFSNHLELANNDPRTEIGKSAIKRIEILDQSIKLKFNEKDNYPDIYPDNFLVQRINDAIIFTIDVRPEILPKEGNISRGGISFSQIDSLIEDGSLEGNEYVKPISEIFSQISQKIGFFLGIMISFKSSFSFFP